jgi:hypothetical protein
VFVRQTKNDVILNYRALLVEDKPDKLRWKIKNDMQIGSFSYQPIFKNFTPAKYKNSGFGNMKKINCKKNLKFRKKIKNTQFFMTFLWLFVTFLWKFSKIYLSKIINYPPWLIFMNEFWWFGIYYTGLIMFWLKKTQVCFYQTIFRPFVSAIFRWYLSNRS